MKYRRVMVSHSLKSPVIRIEAAICPYCNCNLKKIPERQTKCYNCKNIISIRTNASGERFAVTQSQKEEIDRFKMSVKNRQGCTGCLPGCMVYIINILLLIFLSIFLVIIF